MEKIQQQEQLILEAYKMVLCVKFLCLILTFVEGQKKIIYS